MPTFPQLAELDPRRQLERITTRLAALPGVDLSRFDLTRIDVPGVDPARVREVATNAADLALGAATAAVTASADVAQRGIARLRTVADTLVATAR